VIQNPAAFKDTGCRIESGMTRGLFESRKIIQQNAALLCIGQPAERARVISSDQIVAGLPSAFFGNFACSRTPAKTSPRICD
jgi:hypothetical protein